MKNMLVVWLLVSIQAEAQQRPFQFTVSAPLAASHYYHIELQIPALNSDTLILKMARWTPGYYQLLQYAEQLENIKALDAQEKPMAIQKKNENTWTVVSKKGQPLIISYDVKADKQFVAQPYVGSDRAYLVPAGLFLYPEGGLSTPVQVTINIQPNWKVATGLTSKPGKLNEFSAPDFDILFDSPILTGPLEELPAFTVDGVEHRFIGYQLGKFDRGQFMRNLEKVVRAAVLIMGDIPFDQYTFLAIGPGRGGIEHLNNTTISFSGDNLHEPQAMNRMLNFLAHEYFHHYNVKRIRPFELGPFDYDTGSRTNLLWVSEGLSVYYEYLIVKRAGLVDEKALLANFDTNLNAHENNPGRLYQSLAQASYKTWADGPFGKSGSDPNKSISYYDKGPLIGLLLDFNIRQVTGNRKSLDDVMRLLYNRYYKKLQRGFTDAEFQQVCEDIAGTSLDNFFELVYTARPVDYNLYLAYAGLELKSEVDNNRIKFTLQRLEKLNAQQSAILKAWLGE